MPRCTASNPDAVTQEASYEAEALPALFLPNYGSHLRSLQSGRRRPPESYLSLTQYGFWPQFWWVNKK